MSPQAFVRYLEWMDAEYLKSSLINILKWQVSKGQSFYSMGWYARLVCRGFEKEKHDKLKKIERSSVKRGTASISELMAEWVQG